MEEEQSIKQLEKKLAVAWEKKLEKEGFEPAGSAGKHHLYEMIERTFKEERPIEMRVIHEAVFDPKYINKPTYRVYIRR